MARKSPLSQTGPTMSQTISGAFGLLNRADAVVGVVEGRADEVVHRRVDDDESAVAALLHVDAPLVTRMPALPAISRPGSKITRQPILFMCFLTMSA